MKDGSQRPENSNGRGQIRHGTWPRSDAYLPVVLERLRRTMPTRWGGANRAGQAPVPRLRWRTSRRSTAPATAARTNGVRLVDDDPLDALAAELTTRLGDGTVVGAPRHDLRPGRAYLVTGCAGFIGSHLTEALSARGCRSSAWTPSATTTRSTKERNLEQCRGGGDVRFSELDLATGALEPLLDGVDGVFHLAARPGVRTSWGSKLATYLRDNLLGHPADIRGGGN